MPGANAAFQVQSGTQIMSLTTVASTPIQVSTGSLQGLMLDNLSTNAVYATISQSSSVTPVLATTTGPVTGFFLRASQTKTLSAPPNAWVSAMTTGATLTALVAVTGGYGIP